MKDKPKRRLKPSVDHFTKIKCKCADIDPYHHINKYLKDMQTNKGKRIEIIVTGSGSIDDTPYNAHFICNTWKDCLLHIASIYAMKESIF